MPPINLTFFNCHHITIPVRPQATMAIAIASINNDQTFLALHEGVRPCKE